MLNFTVDMFACSADLLRSDYTAVMSAVTWYLLSSFTNCHFCLHNYFPIILFFLGKRPREMINKLHSLEMMYNFYVT